MAHKPPLSIQCLDTSQQILELEMGIPGHGDVDQRHHIFVRIALLDTERLTAVDTAMKIKNVIHKGLRRLIEDDDASGLQPAVVAKIRRMVSFLQDMGTEDELWTVPSWKAHLLTGDRKGTWSLFVTKNWRMTFRIDQDEIEIVDLDYEDYH